MRYRSVWHVLVPCPIDNNHGDESSKKCIGIYGRKGNTQRGRKYSAMPKWNIHSKWSSSNPKHGRNLKQENITRARMALKKGHRLWCRRTRRSNWRLQTEHVEQHLCRFARNDWKKGASFMPFPGPKSSKRWQQLWANRASKAVTANAKKAGAVLNGISPNRTKPT